jgi:hypothetical protein
VILLNNSPVGCKLAWAFSSENNTLCKVVKFRVEAKFSFLVLVFFAFFVWEARNWPLKARLFPWAIGWPMLGLSLYRLVLDVRTSRRTGKPSATNAVDLQFAGPDKTTATIRRTLTICSWMAGFLIAIWLLGFQFAIPLFTFFYLKVQSRENWMISLSLTFVAWLLYWALFEQLVHIPSPRGKIFIWVSKLMLGALPQAN